MICWGSPLAAQTLPQFEVASIKPAPPIEPQKIVGGKMHIGMSIDAARVDIGNLSIADLIRIAYSVKPHQVSGPDWLGGQRFDIVATIPEGVPSSRVPEMLQSLLADRFKLTLHRENKEQNIYALVEGKGGSKLKEAAADAGPGAGESGGNAISMKPNGDGKGMTISGGQMGQAKVAMMEGGMMRMEFPKMPMAMFADTLTRFVDRPVVDATGMKGNYQVALELSMDEMRNVARAAASAAGMMMPGGPGGGADASKGPADAASTPSGGSIFHAVQQMGLKLEARKAPVEVIVIDHVEKTPTAN